MPHKNINDRIEWARKRRWKTKQKLQQIKINHKKCDKCGYSEHPEILEFHHKNKEGKYIDFARGGIGNYSWSTIQKEIKKCDFLCPNCHKWLHFLEKEWFTEKGKTSKKSSDIEELSKELNNKNILKY